MLLQQQQQQRRATALPHGSGDCYAAHTHGKCARFQSHCQLRGSFRRSAAAGSGPQQPVHRRSVARSRSPPSRAPSAVQALVAVPDAPTGRGAAAQRQRRTDNDDGDDDHAAPPPPPPPAAAVATSRRRRPPRAVTARITACESLGELVRVCLEHQPLNQVHVCAALTTCVRLLDDDGDGDDDDAPVAVAVAAVQQPPAELPSAPPSPTAAVGWQRRLRRPPRCAAPVSSHPVVQQHAHSSSSSSNSNNNKNNKNSKKQVDVFVAWALQQLAPQQHLCGPRELATVLWCLAKLGQQPPAAVVQQLLARLADVSPAASSQAVCMALYAVTVLQQQQQQQYQYQQQYQPDGAWLDSMLRSLVDAVHTERAASTSTTGAATPGRGGGGGGGGCTGSQGEQAVCSTLWSLARLQQPAVACAWLPSLLGLLLACDGAGGGGGHTGHRISMQGLSTALWACGVLLSDHQAAADNADQCAQQQLQQQQQQQKVRALVPVVRESAARLLEACLPRVVSARPEEVCMLVWGCSRLRVPLTTTSTPTSSSSSTAMAALWRVSSAALPSFSGGQCARLLCSLAVMRLVPDDEPAAWAAELFRVSQPHLATLTASQLGGMLWACGVLRLRPPEHWMATAVGAFAAACSSSSSSSAAAPPPPSAAATSMLLWGTCRLGFLPAKHDVLCLLATVDEQLPTYRPRHLAPLLLGCASLPLPVPAALLNRVLAAMTAQLGAATPADVVLTLRTLAGFAQAVGARRMRNNSSNNNNSNSNSNPSSSSSHAATAAVAAAASPVPLHTVAAWHARAALARASELLPHMTARQLCQCCWAAAVMRLQLPGGAAPWSAALNSADTVSGIVSQQLGAAELCLLLWSMGRLSRGGSAAAGAAAASGLQMGVQLQLQLVRHSCSLLRAGAFSARDLCMFAWCLQQLPGPRRAFCADAAWFEVFSGAVRCKLRHFSSRQLGVLLRALVLLPATPGLALLDDAALAVELRTAQLSRAELASMSASLLQLWHQRRA